MLETTSTDRSSRKTNQFEEKATEMKTKTIARDNRIDLKTRILTTVAGLIATTLIGGSAMASYSAFDEGNGSQPAPSGACNHVPQPYDPHDAEVQPEFGCGEERVELSLAYPVHMDESEILLAIGGEGAGKKGLALRIARDPMPYDPHDAGELVGAAVTTRTVIGPITGTLNTFDESAITALFERNKVPGSGALAFPLPYDPFDADVILGVRVPAAGKGVGLPALNYPVHMDESEILVSFAVRASDGSVPNVGRNVPQPWDPADSTQGN
ncbi:MAG: hypothetical protein HY678_08965 [Chloroflexi bacterium]|nr:hypothetical protein [Chloroflexota bacterium]